MDNILHELYHGAIHPEEEYQPTEEIRQKRQALDARWRMLLEGIEKTDPEWKREIHTLLEAENCADALEMEEAYVRGMHMGARLASALMQAQT